MNTKTKNQERRPAGRPATTTALAALLTRSSRAQREAFAKPAFQKRSSLPPLHRIGEDGVDHINIADAARTELGELLNTRTMLPFVYDLFGTFASVESVLYYARSVHRDDIFRDLPPIRARARAEREPMHPRLANYRAVAIDAMFQRISQFPELRKAVASSELPFDMYTVGERNTRSRPVDSDWIVEGLERIRKALRTKHTPLLLDHLDDDWKLPSNSVSIKDKLAHQRRAIRLQFVTEAELEKIEAAQAEQLRKRQEEAAARRAQAPADGALDPATEADLQQQEAAADASREEAEAVEQEVRDELEAETNTDRPADAVAIPGLHLTTDAVVVEGAGAGNYVDVSRNEAGALVVTTDEAAPASPLLQNGAPVSGAVQDDSAAS